MSNLSLSNDTDTEEFVIPESGWKQSALMSSVTYYTMMTLFSMIFVAGLANVVLALGALSGKVFQDKVTRIIVFNLTLANGLLVASMPFLLASMIAKKWTLGHVMCKVYWIAEQGNKYTSILYLTYLCCDRYIAVVHANRAHSLRRPFRTKIACTVCWLCAFVAMAPVTMYAGLDKRGRCQIHWPRDAAPNSMPAEHYYSLFTFILLFVLPVMLILTLYGWLLYTLHKLSDRLERASGHTTTVTKLRNETDCTVAPETVVVPPTRGGVGALPRRSRYRRTTLVVLMVTGCHIVLWAPFWISHFVFTLVYQPQPTPAFRLSMKILHMLPYLNTAVFPYFYLIVGLKDSCGRKRSVARRL